MFDLIPDMAAKRAEISPNACAFRDHETDEVWSFRKINTAANGVAEGLRHAGFVEGDRLAILCQNRAEFFVTLFACQKSGVILCPLNWRQPSPEIVETMSPVEPKAILYDADCAELAIQVAEKIGICLFSMDDDAAQWMQHGGPDTAEQIPASRPWYLLFTSGTTGRPKAVIQTARMSWANAVNIGQAIRLSSIDRTLNYLPLFHTAGINLYTLPVFLNGGTTTILRKFDEGAALKLLKNGEITQFFGVPAIYQAFSLCADVDQVDWSGIGCGCGGAPLSEPLIRFFAARGAKVLNGLGMTETGPCVFLMDHENAERKIGSVGRAQMLTDMRLDGVMSGAPGSGEIQLRGPNITPGYFENPLATAETFTEDGWLKTGDVGRRDEDGFLYVVDRIKDMYISGGENVYPAEVERILHEHEAVLEAAVIGVPDDKWGEVGAAFLLLRPKMQIDKAALRVWCRNRLAPYKVPAHVVVVDDFPRTAAGKIRKPDLRLLRTL